MLPATLEACVAWCEAHRSYIRTAHILHRNRSNGTVILVVTLYEYLEPVHDSLIDFELEIYDSGAGDVDFGTRLFGPCDWWESHARETYHSVPGFESLNVEAGAL